jgi:hypothetical protein
VERLVALEAMPTRWLRRSSIGLMENIGSGGGGQRPEGPVDQSRHYHHDCLSSAARLFLGDNSPLILIAPQSLVRQADPLRPIVASLA